MLNYNEPNTSNFILFFLPSIESLKFYPGY